MSIDLPGYRIDAEPDYMRIGQQVDQLICANLVDGKYVVRALGSSDHPDKSLDDLVTIILDSGSDKYDPTRTEIAHEAFAGYDHDFHGTLIEICNGNIVPADDDAYPSMFADIAYHFIECAPLDRGYSVRIDLLILYHASEVERARLVDPKFERVRESLEQHLYKFCIPHNRQRALAALVALPIPD